MDREDHKQSQLADDLDDINTLVNLLELRTQLSIESRHFETELD